MATKYEIKKFLERRQAETVSKLREDKSVDLASINADFILKNQESISDIRLLLDRVDTVFDSLVKDVEASKMGKFSKDHYQNPSQRLGDIISLFNGTGITYYFDIVKTEKAKAKHEKAEHETIVEYTKLIAVTKTMSVKESIALLKGLGFETEELETEKQSTALITNIDARKLFIN